MYIHKHLNERKHIIPDPVPGFPFHSLVSRLWPFTSFKAQPFGSIMPMHAWSRFSPFMVVVCIFLLAACSDFIHPVKSTPEPTEYSFNYWLLNNVYLYEEELPNLREDGDSVQELYTVLKDPYTNYTIPSQSENRATQTSTSLVIGGDVGMRYYNFSDREYPIFISRVYPKGPAGKASIPRYGNILKVNGIELKGEHARNTYDSILTFNKNIELTIAYKGVTTLYKLQKDSVFAPTVFVDTLFEDKDKGYPGIVFVTIETFKIKTEDKKNGTYGEVKDYLISSASDKRVRVLDLRNNPGGVVEQCINVADLFVKSGTLSSRRWRALNADGASVLRRPSNEAKAGDPGETGNFLILANRASASCAEIFIAAVTELTDIPLVGSRTFGKGIGQTQYWTYAGGLATITDIEFRTPKGNSYHGIGVIPKYECTETLYEECAAKVANKLYGVKIPNQDAALAKRGNEFVLNNTSKEFEGGSIEWADSSTYLEAFKKSNR